MLYTAPGNILDWMYARQKIKYSYAVHLRDTGTVRFSAFVIYFFLAHFFFPVSSGLRCLRNGSDQLVKK